MILGNDREAVIENIRRAAEKGDFHSKVETGDPALTDAERVGIVERYLKNRKKSSFKTKAAIARRIAAVATEYFNKDTEIVGAELAEEISGGAIITSNHFSPLENTVIRKYVFSKGKKTLGIVSNVNNFAMKGVIGFLMNYADTIPVPGGVKYMCKELPKLLSEVLSRGDYVLIYPEQEMWFNYRKIRPLKRGAYFYAAKLNVPVISCFVEIRDTDEPDTEEFRKVKYILHILGVIYPDKSKTARENSFIMRDRDFELKRAAYEQAYGKTLDYAFDVSDIAGFIPEDERTKN